MKQFQKQNGAALITSLIFLVILTMLGFSASRSVFMQQLLSRNFSDQRLAIQAAEAALKYAESCIRNSDGNPFDTPASVVASCTGIGAANSLPTAPYDSTSLSAATSAFWLTRGTQYGTLNGGNFTGAPALTLPNGISFSSQPRYVIALTNFFDCLPIGDPDTTQSCLYQITAWGTGINANTQKVVQSIFLL